MTTPDPTEHERSRPSGPPHALRREQPNRDLRREDLAGVLARTWGDSTGGLRGWLSDTSHAAIGKRFLVTALVFFLLGGLEALLMRLQLARSDQALLGPDLYNQVFTAHGTTMMFLFAVPVMQGLAVYLVPLMIGTRNTAFPRLGAFAYYTYLIGGVLLYVSLLGNTGPDAGWFSYVPLAGPDYSPGKRTDVWAQLVTFTEIAALATAVNLIATILKCRAPGMRIDRMPLFVWAMLVQSVMVVFAMPAVMLGSLMLAMDRLVGTHFFNYGEGGDVVLWQHLFWYFGHPEVYIIFLPALGILSSLLVTFTRRQIFGYPALVVSLVATAFVGFGVWAHHMFASGIPRLGASFFTASSVLITVPTGVQFFCWIATLWGGSIRLKTPMLFALGFFLVFVLGGVTGVMLASVPLDLQLHDTHFVVAHLHYVLIGGSVFPLLGGVYYWYPKWTGRLMSERLGRWNFGLFFLGFNLVFFPLHILGLMGMPRRVYTYPGDRGWDDLNLLATVGAGVLALSVLVLLVNMIRSARLGARAGDDPWGADTLEWATASPPPPYNFLDLPTVSGRYALWTRSAKQATVQGLDARRRELLVTRLLEATPDHRTELPGPSTTPLMAALATGVTFIVAIFTPWGIVLGGGLLGVALIAWYWPRHPHRQDMADEQPPRTRTLIPPHVEPQPQRADENLGPNGAPAVQVGHLAMTAFGSRDPLWWGVVGLIAIEASVFAILFASYYYLADLAERWPPMPLPELSRNLAAFGCCLLLASCFPAYRSTRAAERSSLAGMRRTLIWSTALMVGFLVVRWYEFQSLPFRWDTDAYGSVVWTTLGMHTLHALFAAAENLVFIAVLFVGPVEQKHLVDISVNGLYWYFVVAADVLCTFVFDVLPPLTGS